MTRLIDADALKAELEELRPFNWTDSEAEAQEYNDFELFESLIDNAPMIDTENVEILNDLKNFIDLWTRGCIDCTNTKRHGKWKDIDGDGQYWECSACGEVLCCNNNFCPNCGADMRERSEE